MRSSTSSGRARAPVKGAPRGSKEEGAVYPARKRSAKHCSALHGDPLDGDETKRTNDERFSARPRAAGSVAGQEARFHPLLLRALNAYVSTADIAGFLARDPLGLIHAYDRPEDQEIAALLVAMLAYGRVAAIRAKGRELLAALGRRPSLALASESGRRSMTGIVYRFQRGNDLARFAAAVARLREAHGSLGAAFVACDVGSEPGSDYASAMAEFAKALTAEITGDLSPGLRFLVPTTERGGAAKRLALYLRWMVRPNDGVDLGTWAALGLPVDAGRLIVPLDTHVHRISRAIGLSARKSPDLRAAREITSALRCLRPSDPLVYDLALCHLGISGQCPQRRVPRLCGSCPIQSICRLGGHAERTSGA